MRKAEDFRQKLKKVAVSRPHDAIELIREFWYDSYVKEKELDIGKIDVLYALASVKILSVVFWNVWNNCQN